MQKTGYFIQLLYLLVYSGALISIASVAVFRNRMKSSYDAPLKQLVCSIAFFSIILSLQVFINATGLTERLQESGTNRIILILNSLTIVCITAMTRATVLISLSLRRGTFNIIFNKTITSLIAVLLLAAGVLQLMTLFFKSLRASELLGNLMIAGTGMFYAGIIFSTIRLFLPLSLESDPEVTSSVRNLHLALCMFPLAFLISGNLIGTMLAPAGFLILNILSLRIIYFRLKSHEPDTAIEEEIQNNSETFNPLSACREIGLSKRESEVALLLASGKSYKEIAAELFISMSTTQTHVGRIYTKLGINNKTELSNLIYFKKNSL